MRWHQRLRNFLLAIHISKLLYTDRLLETSCMKSCARWRSVQMREVPVSVQLHAPRLCQCTRLSAISPNLLCVPFLSLTPFPASRVAFKSSHWGPVPDPLTQSLVLPTPTISSLSNHGTQQMIFITQVSFSHSTHRGLFEHDMSYLCHWSRHL